MIVWLLRTLANFAVVGVVALALYTHRDRLGTMVENWSAAKPEAAAVAVEPDAGSSDAGSAGKMQTLRLRADRRGYFFVVADIHGTAVRFILDPAASEVVLAPADAARAGIMPAESAFTARFSTANGTVRAADIVLNDVRIGALRLARLDAVVTERPIGVSILGETFLRRLKTYRRSGDEMLLTW